MENKLPTIGKKEWAFILALGKERKTLSEIQKKINPKAEVCVAHKIFKKLNSFGMIETFKEATKRYVQLNEQGIYFLEFYLKFRSKK